MDTSDDSLAALLTYAQDTLAHARAEVDRRTANRDRVVRTAAAGGWSPGRIARTAGLSRSAVVKILRARG